FGAYIHHQFCRNPYILSDIFLICIFLQFFSFLLVLIILFRLFSFFGANRMMGGEEGQEDPKPFDI
ncbi:hypothetical protein L9F63_007924, partial [Diploptera punctata]